MATGLTTKTKTTNGTNKVTTAFRIFPLPEFSAEQLAQVERCFAWIVVDRKLTAENAQSLDAVWRAKGKELSTEEVAAAIGPAPPPRPGSPIGQRIVHSEFGFGHMLSGCNRYHIWIATSISS